MRLFTACPVCKRRIDIAANAATRADLPPAFQVGCPHQDYAANGFIVGCFARNVYAERGHAGTVGGSTVGAAVGGLVAGPLGLGIGLLVGLFLGAAADADEQRVTEFNNS